MYFIANWKMNPPSLEEASRLLQQLKKQIKGLGNTKKSQKSKIVICPPALFLGKLGKPSGLIEFGMQNIGWAERGAYTGEISILMVKNMGVNFCIVGHSERKIYFHESVEQANKKVRLCLYKRITPVYCIGETKEQKKKGKTRAVIENQLKKGLAGIGLIDVKNVVIAYEPLWAISSQKNAKPVDPDEVLGVNILIKKIISNLYDQKIARKINILYGGSVDQKNVTSYVLNQSVDGFLVGSASLNAINFAAIIKKSLIYSKC